MQNQKQVSMNILFIVHQNRKVDYSTKAEKCHNSWNEQNQSKENLNIDLSTMNYKSNMPKITIFFS